MAAQRDLKVVVSAKDEASSKLAKMNKSIQAGLKKTAIAAAAAGAAMAVGLKKAVDAAAEAERAQRQLEHAIIGLSGGTKEQVKRIDELTTAMEKKIGVDGDALKMGIAQLGTFQLQSDTVEALSKTVADLTINNKGLTATGQDYVANANLIQKALEGQFGRLEVIGIKFTEAQKHLIQFGTETEKVKALQEGFAQNLRETSDTVGGLDVAQAKLSVTMGEISERIGTALAPALVQLSEQMLPVIQRVSDFVANNQQLVVGLIKWSAIILPILVILPLLVSAIGAVSTAFLFLAANPIVLVIAAITALIASIVLLIKNWDKVKAKTAAAWAQMVEKIKFHIEVLKQVFLMMFESLNNIFTAGWSLILEGWTGFWDGMKAVAQVAVDFITGIIEKIVGTILKVIQKLEELKEKAGRGLAAAGSAVRGAASSVANRFRAQGGTVFKGQTAVVGENGPEAVTFGKTGTVIPNSRMGGGGTVVNVNVSGNTMMGGNSDELATMIGDKIIGQLRLNARLS